MKKTKLITITCTFLIVAGIFSTLFLSEKIGDRVSQIITISTALIGAVALFLQFKRDKDINESSFILEFWKSFSQNDDLQQIMLKCDNMLNNKENQFVKEDYSSIVKYAQWLEAFSSLINRKVVSINSINDMYNYMFFVFTNNQYIQKLELEPNKEYYNGIYHAYAEWIKFLNKKNLPIIGKDHPLIKEN